MPEVTLEMLLPNAPLHPITILHYLVILGALWLVISAGDEGTTINTVISAGIALMAVINLYATLIRIPGIIIFAIRVVMVMLCLITTGMAPNPKARSFGILLTLLALPILIVLFIPTFDPFFYHIY